MPAFEYSKHSIDECTVNVYLHFLASLEEVKKNVLCRDHVRLSACLCIHPAVTIVP